MMHFKKLDIEPLPLVISATGKIFLTSDVALNADLPADAEVTLEMNKTVTFGSKKFQLTIPCVDGIGSCTVKVCDVFKLWYNDILCPLIKGGGHGCSCPIKVNYRLWENFFCTSSKTLTESVFFLPFLSFIPTGRQLSQPAH